MDFITRISLTGQDKPGVTASLTEILSDYNVKILDIGQSVVHDFLSFGIVVSIPKHSQASPVFKDLLFKANELGLTMNFVPLSTKTYETWVKNEKQDRFVITLLAREVSSEHIHLVTKIISRYKLNIEYLDRLSGRRPLKKNNHERNCLEFSVVGKLRNEKKIRAELLALSQTMDMDVAFQRHDVFRRNRKLVVFDMDSTLIQAEVIDELAKAHNVGDKVSAITEETMRGNLDFKESFKKRLSLLKGLREPILKQIAKNLPVTEGAERTIRMLKSLGYKTAIISGGFTYFGNYLQDNLGIDHVFANQLEIKSGFVTGRVKGEIVDATKKAELLESLAKQEGIQLEQTVAVGDGANDLLMLQKAGLGVAFHAKPIVKEKASHAISNLGLDAILYLLGVSDREIDADSRRRKKH